MAEPKITITDGAYLVEGDVPLYQEVIVKSADGTHLEYKRTEQIETPSGSYLLCRCGRSKIKPFCDYAHMLEQPPFDGAEAADKRTHEERSKLFEGHGITLHDDGRCAYARLCHYNDETIWEITRKDGEAGAGADGESGNAKDDLRQRIIEAAWNCPTGRLVAIDSVTGQEYEQDFEPSISLIEDSGLDCSGPLFVRGGIPLVSQDGTEYERRNRYALCRCGKTTNTPFCDATHHHVGFTDGIQA